jgi:hypothetical protein
MTLGANDKKKVGVLAVLGLVMAYLMYTNLFSGPPAAPASESTARVRPSVAAPPSIPMPEPTTVARPPAPSRSAQKRAEEFHPVVRSKRPEERIDPTKVDPTLRLDLFARVQSASLSGATGRNLFQFSTPPPKEPVKLPTEPVIALKVGPVQPPPPPPPAPKVEPTPPPITLKFYGYSTGRTNGKKTAYFMDGDEILLGAEGDTLKKRYKVIRISATSAVIEDVEARRQQSIPLAEEAQG